MQLPLQISFLNLPPSPSVEAVVKEKAEKLDRFAEHIMSCHVFIEAPHKHQHKGELYQVRIDITVPDKEIVATHHSDRNHAHEDVFVAIRDAFNAAKRQLEDYVRQRRSDVKQHDTQPFGRIQKIFPESDYGLITTSDNREVYFHRNSVLGEQFDHLQEGMRVHFTEEMGEQGPQASTVHVEGKHHVVG
jgi:ribosomal subunit interface protein